MFVVFVCVLVAIVAAISQASRVAKLAAGGAFLTATGYAALLFTVAFVSSDKTLPAGGWKYFCEADCHIAYTIDNVQTASTLGPEAKPISAQGRFVVVRVKTWFDEHSIAPFRGNSPLIPDSRTVQLVDGRGRYYFPLPQAGAVLRSDSTPLTEPLRPGETYVSSFVFDLPADSRDARLLIADVDPVSRLLIDHENSPLHGKIYLALPANQSAAASTLP
jgi:hypothetical protein